MRCGTTGGSSRSRPRSHSCLLSQSGVWLANSQAAVEASAPEAVREAYVEEDFEAYYSSEPAAQFASEVFVNNVQVAIYAFAAGILLCGVTAYILILNGSNLGVAAGLFAAAGESPKFWGLILPHGLLELSAVVIAGAAGLRLGWAIIDPGDRARRDALAEQGRRSVVIILGLIVVFAVAGVIEGFVTGSSLHDVLPRRARRHGGARVLALHRHAGPARRAQRVHRTAQRGGSRDPRSARTSARGGRARHVIAGSSGKSLSARPSMPWRYAGRITSAADDREEDHSRARNRRVQAHLLREPSLEQ